MCVSSPAIFSILSTWLPAEHQNSPILTYGRQGCVNMSDEKAAKHGIIHMASSKPERLLLEPELGVEPICARMTAPGQILAKESRINYAKLATIEHNAMVSFIGHVIYHDIPEVAEAVDRCWRRAFRSPSPRVRRERPSRRPEWPTSPQPDLSSSRN